MRAEYAERRPAPALRGLLGPYVGYRIEGMPPGEHRGLPSSSLALVLPFDGPLRIARADGAPLVADPVAVVGGLHDRAVRIRHDGVQYGVQLSVTPRGARALLGLPAGELAGLVVPLADLAPWAGRLAERLAAAATWAARFDVLDAELCRVAIRRHGAGRPGGTPPPEVERAWSVLRATGGAVPVARLAGEVGWSRRHLAERFRREFGLTPKVTGRVFRLQRARAALLDPAAGAAVRLADVAARCGYADQAHLAREWRELTGCAPSVWLAEEAPFLVRHLADEPPD